MTLSDVGTTWTVPFTTLITSDQCLSKLNMVTDFVGLWAKQCVSAWNDVTPVRGLCLPCTQNQVVIYGESPTPPTSAAAWLLALFHSFITPPFIRVRL